MNQKSKLVLMPGLDGTGKLFSPIIPLLEPHFDLTVVTYPDLGSFNDYIECAQNQLPPAPGYSLLAESFSGPVAIAIIANRPDQVGPSVLCSTFARSPLVALNRMASQVPAGVFSIGALSDFCLEVSEVDSEDFSETQPLPASATAQLDGAVLKHKIEVLSRIDVSGLLPMVDVPILQLHGLQDRIVAAADARLVQQNLPAVRRVDIGGPHLLLQCRPQECAGEIVAHLRASRQGSA